MSIVGPTLICLLCYAAGYFLYSRFLASRVFRLDPAKTTPAHRFNDGVDYVPTPRRILFGHHFASIAGLAPMLGPAVAVIWGWLPAMIWVVLGAVFVGCVHDFATLVLSLRARGMSIGVIAQGILGRRAKTLFHVIIFFGVALAMGVFVYVLGALFSVNINPTTKGYPEAVTPSAGLMVVAVIFGYLYYRKNVGLLPLSIVSFAASLALIYLGFRFPTMGLDPQVWPGSELWIFVLLAYAFIASVLPVWILLQARDFVNSLLLYLGLIAAYVGVFVAAPTFQAPMARTQVEGAPSLIPFVFIIIACGAASGFHGLVSSGTTAKQVDSETDARPVGYGGMIAESLLGLLAVLATTAGMGSQEAWNVRYENWESVQGLSGNVSSFIGGAARFVSALGVPDELASAFIAVVVVSFALTTLDSATRLLRYNIEEIMQGLGVRLFQNRYVSSLAAVVVIAGFAFYKVNGVSAALALWTLFGTTNQLLAALTLLTVTLYLKQRGLPMVYTGLPALFMLVTTFVSMSINLVEFAMGSQMLLFGVGGVLWVLALWIVVEAARGFRSTQHRDDLEIDIV